MSYSRFRQAVAENIREERKKVGLTQEDMANFGFNVRHYQDIEAGKIDISLETLYRIASAFKINPDLLTRSENKR